MVSSVWGVEGEKKENLNDWSRRGHDTGLQTKERRVSPWGSPETGWSAGVPPRLTLSIAPCSLQEKREAKCHKHFPARKMLRDINKDLNSAVNFRNEESSPSLPRALSQSAAVLKGNRCYSPLGFVSRLFMIPLPGFYIIFRHTARRDLWMWSLSFPPQRLLFCRIKAAIPPSTLKGSVEFHMT